MQKNKGKSLGLIRNLFMSILLIVILFLTYAFMCILPVKSINVSDLTYYETQDYLSLDQIPKDLQNSFIAIEDHRFYSHFGIDPIAILGSGIDNIKSRSIVRGGSTITQQLIKNTFLSPDKKLKRKIQEAFLAIRLERRLSKEKILELYLNTIYLGNKSTGVSQGAKRYFNKDPKDLNLAESALIASITKSPANYCPVKLKKYSGRDPNAIKTLTIDGEKYNVYINERSIQRQKIVLHRMYELGYINYEEYLQAKDYPIEKNIKFIF